MATRSETIAQVVRRRHAVALARRRLLAFALHADEEDSFDELEVTHPFRRTARGTTPPGTDTPASEPPATDPPATELTLADRIEELRARAAAYRAQAIALNAKLAMHETELGGLRAMREQLAASSARLEHAVDDIDAVATLEQQIAKIDR